MKPTLLLLLSMLLAPALITASPDTDSFQLIKQDRVLTLYERWIPGTGGGLVRELKAVFEVRASAGEIVSLLGNEALVSRWNAGVISAAIYPLPSTGNWLCYLKYDIPWPFNDQDCLLSYRVSAGCDGAATVSFHSVENSRFPVPRGFDRLTHVRGQWIITPAASGQVKVTYLITTDRSRQIPRWVSDPVIHHNIFQTLTAFKRIAEQRS